MKHFKRRFEEGYDVPGDTHYIQWLKIHHPESSISHLADPFGTMECHDTHPDPVNYDKNINYSTNSPSYPELTVQGLNNCSQNSSSLILAKRSKLHSFLKIPTPLAHKSLQSKSKNQRCKGTHKPGILGRI